jgi:hypothetical protein
VSGLARDDPDDEPSWLARTEVYHRPFVNKRRSFVDFFSAHRRKSTVNGELRQTQTTGSNFQLKNSMPICTTK